MAYQYSTLLNDGFFDVVLDTLLEGGAPTLTIFGSDGIALVTLTFPEVLELSRTESSLLLAIPDSVMVLADGEATTAAIYNGAGEVVVTFGVGSETTNPEAELIISSTALYAGGMITINKVELVI